MPSLPNILFFGESVSLSHVVRPLMLAQTLDATQYDVTFAASASIPSLGPIGGNVRGQVIESPDSKAFVEQADRGRFALTVDDLRRYLTDDLRLMKELKPSLVVSDFRFSVAMSAELLGIRHIAISNLYWSPYRQLGFDPTPDFVKRQPPSEKRSATRIVNELRTELGLPLVDGYCSLVTRGNYAAYADPPALIETTELPDNHAVLGPILWEPQMKKWDWLDGPLARPLIYINLGSTGDVRILSDILGALAPISGTVLAATAGRAHIVDPPSNVRLFDFVPGADVCRVADLVVCNGGSGAIYQALREGVPVLGIWSNIDQYLSSRVVQNAGAARALQASMVNTDVIIDAARTLLTDTRYRQAAIRLSSAVRALDPRDTFPALVRRALSSMTLPSISPRS